MNMFSIMIEGFLKTLPQEYLQQIKSSFNKIDEFLPMIEGFQNNVALDKEKNEKAVAFLLSVDDGKILLRQVALAPNEETKKVEISRTIFETDVLVKAKELVEHI